MIVIIRRVRNYLLDEMFNMRVLSNKIDICNYDSIGYLDNKKIGFFGRIHPKIEKSDIYVMELSIDDIDVKTKPIKYKASSKYPEIKKDMAFIVDKNISSKDIETEIKRVGGRLLTNIDVFDVYVGENIGLDKKSIAYNLTFSSVDRTLTDDEVMEVFNSIISKVETKMNAKLRNE